MKLFLFCFLISFVSASYRPYRPFSSRNTRSGVTIAPKRIGVPANLNPADFTNKSWELMAQINSQSKVSSYWVPIEVINPTKVLAHGDVISMQILAGESICAKAGTLKFYEINPTSCPVKEGGERALYEVSINTRFHNEFVSITTNKVKTPAGEKPSNANILD